MKKKILASWMAVIMLAAVPAEAVLASETGLSEEIIWLDSEDMDETASVSANSEDMLDEDIFADTDSQEAETDTSEETDSAESSSSTEDMLDDDDMFVDANASDMLDDDDMFVDANASDMLDDDDMFVDANASDMLDGDDMFVDMDASGEEAETEAAVSTTVSGTCGADTSNLTWTLEDGVLTISGTGAMATYAVNTTSVTDSTTNPPWFAYNDTITSVVIESGVTSIGAYAFMHCTALTSISIPDTVTAIGARAFYECTALTSIVIPDSVTTISSYAFLYCSSLKSVTLSDNLTAITMCMFAGCSSLTSITIPGKVTSIATSAFSGCDSLTSITIPASVTTISAWALSDLPALTTITVAADNSVYSSVDGVLFNKAQTELILYPMAKTGTSYTIPTGVTTIADGAFCSCQFTSVTIPDTVTAIGEYAFDSCTALTSVTIPDSVTSVGACAFYGCTSLKTAVVGSGVTSLETYLFEHCTSLTTVTIPAGVTSVGEWAFYKCTSLAAVYYKGTKTAWVSVSIESYNDPLTSATVYYDLGACAITLSKSSYTYDGTAKKPTVTVKDGSTTLTAGTDYTVKGYSSNKKPGTATVTLTGKGDYSGSTATVNFTINKVSQTLSVSTSASTITTGSAATISASGIGTFTYSSSDKSIAKVSSDGVVTGKKAGTVTITVTAAGNSKTASASETIKIKVKLASCSISSLTNTAKGITVKWKKVTGADGYYVKRKTSGGSYKVVATITSGSTLKYVDTGVKSKYGTVYTYKVVAYGGTSTGSGTAKKTVRLKAPAISAVTNSSSGSVTVTWGKVSKGTGYQIQYSTSSSFTSAKTVWVTSRTQVSAAIAGLTSGNTYYVRIRTYDTDSAGTKYYSAWSSTKSVKITR